MQKIDLILENIRNQYTYNLLEESDTVTPLSEREVLKGKMFINESTAMIRKMLIEEGVIAGVRQSLSYDFAGIIQESLLDDAEGYMDQGVNYANQAIDSGKNMANQAIDSGRTMANQAIGDYNEYKRFNSLSPEDQMVEKMSPAERERYTIGKDYDSKLAGANTMIDNGVNAARNGYDQVAGAARNGYEQVTAAAPGIVRNAYIDTSIGADRLGTAAGQYYDQASDQVRGASAGQIAGASAAALGLGAAAMGAKSLSDPAVRISMSDGYNRGAKDSDYKGSYAAGAAARKVSDAYNGATRNLGGRIGGLRSRFTK